MEDSEPNSRKRARSAASSAKQGAISSTSTSHQEEILTPVEAAELDRSRAAQLRRTYGTTTTTGGAGTRSDPPSSVAVVPQTTPTLSTRHSRRTTVLNDLLRASMAHDKVYALSSDEILHELVLMAAHDCLQWPENAPLPSESELSSGAQVGGGNRAATIPPSPSPPSALPTFSSKRCWLEAPTVAAQQWADHWKLHLGPNRCQLPEVALRQLEVVLVIIRNLSFVSSNLRLLAYSPAVWHLLIGCLYDGTDHGLNSDDTSSAATSSATTSVLLSHSAMHALLNLAPHLDVSGQRLCGDKLFYPPPPSPLTAATSAATTTTTTAAAAATLAETPPVPQPSNFGLTVGGHWGFGGLWLAKRLDTKEDTLNDVSSEFVLSLTSQYLVAVWSLFPALHHLLTQPKPPPRAVVLLALDLLQDLINQAKSGMVGKVHTHDALETNSHDDDAPAVDGTTHSIPSIRQILVHMPDALLDRLVDWLYVPRLGPDALEYIDPTQNVVTRITSLKLLMGYDATIDSDVRDRVLEVLVPLLELDSPRMAARIGQCGTTNNTGLPRLKLFDSLVPILTTNAGRSEASSLAVQLLRELNLAPENAYGIDYIRPRLVELASRDARVSNLLWHHLTPRAASDSDDNDNEQEEEEDGEDEEEEGEGATNSSDDSTH